MSLFANIDFKTVQWGSTVILHLLRGCSAGLVWAIVILSQAGRASEVPWWAMPVIVPIGYLFFLPFYLLAVKIFTAFVGDNLGQLAVAVATIIFTLGIAVGDPLVYVLHKNKPSFVPVEKFNFINFSLLVFVLDPLRTVVSST